MTTRSPADPPAAHEPGVASISLDVLLDELEADSAPELQQIDRDALETMILSDPALRDYFGEAP